MSLVCNVQLIKIVENRLAKFTDTESQCAMLLIVGEYADLASSGPYIIEHVLNGQALDQSSPTSGRLLTCLLTACCRLFLRQPAEYQHILGHVLELCLNSSDANVHDKAAMYYMLLSTDIQLATTAILSATESSNTNRL